MTDDRKAMGDDRVLTTGLYCHPSSVTGHHVLWSSVTGRRSSALQRQFVDPVPLVRDAPPPLHEPEDDPVILQHP